MLTATTVSSDKDLSAILALQQKNLKQNITAGEKESQGFVTMEFTMPMLRQLNDMAPAIIVKDDDQVVAYAMVLLQAGRNLYADLEPMFVNFERLNWQGKPLYDQPFYVMGQICIDKNYRGQGVFDMLYFKHREIYQHRFAFIVTEISTSNFRSLRAHERIGFQTINVFSDTMDEWAVVLWDWR